MISKRMIQDGISETKEPTILFHGQNIKYFDKLFSKLRTFRNKPAKFWRFIVNDPNHLTKQSSVKSFGPFMIKTWKEIDDFTTKHFDEFQFEVIIDPRDEKYMEPTITVKLIRRIE